MDPTAPNNPQSGSNYDSLVNGNSSEKNIIEPGQFVVAGEDPKTASTNNPPQTQNPVAAQQTQAPKGPQLASNRIGAQTNQAMPASPPAPPPPAPPNPPIPNTPLPPPPSQPDPTPFSAQSSQFTPPVGANSTQPPSKMKKLKTIFILLVLLVLIGIIAAVAYVFVLKKDFKLPGSSQEEIKTDVSNTVPDEPLPSPQKGGGFSTLPQSTDEANFESTQTSEPSVP